MKFTLAIFATVTTLSLAQPIENKDREIAVNKAVQLVSAGFLIRTMYT